MKFLIVVNFGKVEKVDESLLKEILSQQILSVIVVASAAPRPQGSRFELEDLQLPVQSRQFPAQEREIENDVNPADLIQSIVRSLSSLGGGGGGRQSGPDGNLLRILINLVAGEFGLGGRNDGRSDGVDQEVFIRNLIRTFTSIVGNALLS